MNKLGSLTAISERVDACRRECAENGVPFHADALAAALGVSYDTLIHLAAGEDTSKTMADLLGGALQECTASVLSHAMTADPKHHAFLMWYLRNRSGFSDKAGDAPRFETAAVTFVGEGRI